MSVTNDWVDDPAFDDTLFAEYLPTHPLGLVDVGSRGGIHPLWSPLARHTETLAFEADAAECARLEREAAEQIIWRTLEVVPCVVAASSGKIKFHRFKSPVNDSVFPAHAPFVQRYNVGSLEPAGDIELEARRLDDIVFEAAREHRAYGDALKLDVQGAELEVLAGAPRLLAERALAIVAEVSFCEIFSGQPRFAEVERFLRALGFSFYGFLGLHQRSTRRLDKRAMAGRERTIWGDAVFFKDPLDAPDSPPPTPERMVKLAALAALLGFYDFALELCAQCPGPTARVAATQDFLRARALVPRDSIIQAVNNLAMRIGAEPQRALPLLGKFVDTWRHFSDFDDIPDA